MVQVQVQELFGSSSNLTLNAGDSNIVFTNTASGATLVISLSGNTTLNKITLNRGAAVASNNFNLIANPITINSIIDNCTAAHILQFQQGRTFTIGNFLVRGSAGNLVTIRSNGASVATLSKSPLGIINTDYITNTAGQPVNASPANTWYIGTNSTAPGTGWVATNYPARGLGTEGVG
jgi:hypothetical protein